jgi:hypothetical protein
MQFNPELIALIREGIKTQTRRPVSDGDTLETELYEGFFNEAPFQHVAVTNNGRIRWQVANFYAIQPRGGAKGIGFIQMTDIRQERLGDITQADALAEGFASREAFFAY